MTESLDAGGIVTEALQTHAYPARHLGSASIGEAQQLRRIGDGHDARYDGHVHAQPVCLVHEPEIRIAVEEVLRDRRIGPRLDLGGKRLQVGLRRAGLGMKLGVGGHFDVEGVAHLGANESHQIAGVLKLTTQAIATGQVAAQGHEALDAHALQLFELFAHGRFGGPHARKMGGRCHALGLDFGHGSKRALLGGAAGAIGHRTELRPLGIQLLTNHAQFDSALRRLGREKLKTQGQAHTKNSRLPSPPVMALSK